MCKEDLQEIIEAYWHVNAKALVTQAYKYWEYGVSDGVVKLDLTTGLVSVTNSLSYSKDEDECFLTLFKLSKDENLDISLLDVRRILTKYIKGQHKFKNRIVKVENLSTLELLDLAGLDIYSDFVLPKLIAKGLELTDLKTNVY